MIKTILAGVVALAVTAPLPQDTVKTQPTIADGSEVTKEQSFDGTINARGDWKPFMDFRTVTDTSSKQYEFISNPETFVNENGLLMRGKCYLVAMGSAWGEVGTQWMIHLTTGQTLRVVKADEIQDQHTIAGAGYTGINGNTIEFIVDTQTLHADALYSGNCDAIGELRGAILYIEEVR